MQSTAILNEINRLAAQYHIERIQIERTLIKISAYIITAVAVIAIALPTILHDAGIPPGYDGPTTGLLVKRALVITTSDAVLNAPGETTGDRKDVFASELTHP